VKGGGAAGGYCRGGDRAIWLGGPETLRGGPENGKRSGQTRQ
jgi:hypothetical protein